MSIWWGKNSAWNKIEKKNNAQTKKNKLRTRADDRFLALFPHIRMWASRWMRGEKKVETTTTTTNYLHSFNSIFLSLLFQCLGRYLTKKTLAKWMQSKIITVCVILILFFVVLHTLCYNLAIDKVYSIYVSFFLASFN